MTKKTGRGKGGDGGMENGLEADGTWRSPAWRGVGKDDDELAGYGQGSEYEAQLAADSEIRRALHEARKVSDDLRELFAGTREGESGSVATDAAYRRYETVAERLNGRVLGGVVAWFRRAREQRALVLAIATSGVSTETEMVEVLEVVLMDLDGTLHYHQKLRPEYVLEGRFGGEEYHGHTLESLAHEPSFREAYAGFAAALEGRRIVAYNAPWVSRVLELECERAFRPNPLEELGLDACVMAHRSRFAAQYMVSTGAHRSLPLGSADPTPLGVARTVCDVVRAYADADTFSPEHPYDPWGRGDWELREHRFGWQDARKPEDHETDAEASLREAREEREALEKREARVAELMAGGMSREEAERETEPSWEDVPF